MAEIFSKDEMEGKIQDAVFRTEEEIMSCPLLQKAMQKVEEEALKGAEPPKEFFDIGLSSGSRESTAVCHRHGCALQAGGRVHGEQANGRLLVPGVSGPHQQGGRIMWLNRRGENGFDEVDWSRRVSNH